MSLFDTHAHLDLDPLASDEAGVVARAKAVGVTRIVTVGIDVERSEASVAIAHRHAGIYATIGVHPNDSATLDEKSLARLDGLASCDKVVAVGETGLDFYRDRAPRDMQERAFREQIRLARRHRLPVVVHNRDAHADTMRILREEKAEEVGGVLHCFSGDAELAREAVALDFLISIPGTVTYKSNETLRDVVRKTPTERLLLETDCPFLAPVPHRGKTNEPSFLPLVAAKVAELKGLSVEDVARITTGNALRLFRIPADEEVQVAYAIRDSLYLNATNRCTNACVFCAKRSDWRVKGHLLKLAEEPTPDAMLAAAADVSKYREVVFCGFGEPLLRLDAVVAVARELKRRGSRRIRINTDGLANLVHGRNVLPELAGLVDALSVSLNAGDAETYAKLCPSRFGLSAYPALLDFLREAPKHVPEVVATAVALPGLDTDAVRRVAEGIPGIAFRLRPFDEVG